jgi:oligopeptidase B
VRGWQSLSRTTAARGAVPKIKIKMKNDVQSDGVGFSLNGQGDPPQQAAATKGNAREAGGAGDRYNMAKDAGMKARATKDSESEGGGVDRQGAAVGSAEPPLAMRHPAEHVIHGDRRVDHYAWMREKRDPRVKEYLEAENAYADELMRTTDELQERLYQEMLGRIQQTDLSVPYLLRGYEYYTRTEEGKQYSIYCRRRVGLADGRNLGPADRPLRNEGVISSQIPDIRQSEEEVLLDLNELAAGHTYMGLGIFEMSDDNRLLAYATDRTGFRQYVLEVKDLETGAMLPFRMERVTSAAWSHDGRVLFYVTEDEVTKRSNQLRRHEIAEATPRAGQQTGVPGNDELIYEERDERFRIDVEKSRSGAYLFLVSNSHTTSEVRYLRADRPRGAFQLVAEREDDHEYYLDHHPGGASDPAGGIFFVRTNSGGRTYRLMTAPTEDPVRSRWREVIGNRPKVMLSGLEAFRTHLVLLEREDGLPYLRIIDLTREAPTAQAASKRIEFAEPAYNAMLGNNPEFDTTFVRFQYESMVTPRSVYDYHVKTGRRTLRKQQPVLGGYDSGLYVSERLHANAPDGTAVPISLVRRKDTLRDGSAPLLLYGYGSYGLSMPVTFSSNRLSLLDRGFVYAIAHIRGGGELGKPWHDAGRMHRKMATFTDFIACAEYLIAKRYTQKGRLVIEGGSAGGLLMGAVTNMRPDLFRVVVSHVPFVDVLNTMLDASLPLTVGEYEEWGNPQVEKDYFYMKMYCPYTNVERKPYPRMLVKTAWNDSQVMYWEAAKYVAKLRAMKTDGNVLLLKTNMGAGHGGASGRYDFLREIALDYAFVLRELGMDEEGTKVKGSRV